MTFAALVRLQLRRYRALFFGVLALLVVHELAFLLLFPFWAKQVEFADLVLSLIPGRVREGFGVPLSDLRDPTTYKALVLLRPDLRALTLLFGITVGTDAIAGETGRGTSDLVFSHPVRRSTAVLASAGAILVHLLCVGATMVAAYAVLARWLPMGPEQPALSRYALAVGNVVLAGFAISLTALLAGCAFATRMRAVGAAVLLVFVPIVLDFMGLFTSALVPFARAFPEHYYRPHVMLAGVDEPSFAACAGALLLLGAIALALSLALAARRDLR